MFDIIIETLIDALKILPFLFIAFLLIELFEHKFSNKTKKFVEKSGKFGPIFASLAGIFPQCGFSVAATNLYITRVISLGTLFSVYLSTSDEMLPILISKNADFKLIVLILSIKFICGIIFGFIIDFLFVNRNKKLNYDLCDNVHCDCEHGIFKSSLKHTVTIMIFIVLVSFILNVLFEYTSETIINKVFMKESIFGPFLGSLIGLIPNCGASVILTELLLKNTINLGTCISGLLTGSGVAIIVLFRENKNVKENILIVSTLYFIGVLVGIIVEIIAMII